jgi:6-phosphogluconolactonase
LSADGRFLFVPDLGADNVLIFRFDKSNGKLTANDPAFAKVKPGAGPRHFTFSPDGKFAYVLNEMGSHVTGFRFDPAKGALAEIQEISTLPTDFSGQNNSAEIEVDSTGHFLYASNRGHDSIAVFSIDHTTGKLTSIAITSTQGKTPRNFAIDPSGKNLLVANQDSNDIVAFRRDSATGKLTPANKTVETPSPVCLLFVPVA